MSLARQLQDLRPDICQQGVKVSAAAQVSPVPLTPRRHAQECLEVMPQASMCTVHVCVLKGSVFFRSIWDVEQGTKLVTQYNSNAKITAVEFVNPHDITFLMTGSGI